MHFLHSIFIEGKFICIYFLFFIKEVIILPLYNIHLSNVVHNWLKCLLIFYSRYVISYIWTSTRSFVHKQKQFARDDQLFYGIICDRIMYVCTLYSPKLSLNKVNGRFKVCTFSRSWADVFYRLTFNANL